MPKRLSALVAIVASCVAVAITAMVVVPRDAGATSSGGGRSVRTIKVVGVGEVHGTPDVADLSIGVSGKADTAAGALGEISDRAQKVIQVLRDAGIAEADIQTTDLSVQPDLDDHDHVTGYEATNTVSARIRDLTKAGDVVDAAAGAAGDAIRIQGITFSIDDDSKLLAAARTLATKRARAHAEQLAAGAGVEVDTVRTITESSSNQPVSYPADAAASAARTPVMPGSESLSVSATVVFTIA
jgi:uncharacterized protein YggE